MGKNELSTFSPFSRNVAAGEKFNAIIPQKGGKICVVGAGIMGVCSAYYLQRSGYKVTLIDKRGPGNSASSSGGESRLLRLIYGASEFYSSLTLKALPLWMELQKGKEPFYIPSPVLWISNEKNADIIKQSLTFLESNSIGFKSISKAQLRKEWSFMRCDDIELAVMEEISGYLKARNACQSIASLFVEIGGTLAIEEAKPLQGIQGEVHSIETTTGRITFDYLVVAAGPWLNQWSIDPLIEVTRQEILYFDIPNRAAWANLTSWVDLSYEPYFYGIPGDLSRGFKLACDERGTGFDPDSGERVPSDSSLVEARKFMDFRFPSLAKAPLLESRVCQYSNSNDRNLILDIHPQHPNVLLVGGGSGHGFKYGPAIGNIVADVVSGDIPLPGEMRYF